MMKFDKKVKSILNEDGIGKFISAVGGGAVNAASSAYRAAQKPGEGIKNILNYPITKSDEEKKKESKAISQENPVKGRGQRVFCQTNSYRYNNTSKEWYLDPVDLYGFTEGKSDPQGNFVVKLISPDYVFFKRIANYKGVNSVQVSITKKGTAIPAGLTIIGNQYKVGPTRNDLEPSLKTWYMA